MSKIAKPMSRSSIRDFTEIFRATCDVFLEAKTGIYFPVIDYLDKVLPNLVEDISICIEEGCNMPIYNAEGIAYPDNKEIFIREDVYEGAYRGDCRSRFTIMHELGHYFMHGRQGYARTTHNTEGRIIKPYEDPEWQANTFSGEVLVPASMKNHFLSVGAEITAFECGVSLQVAEIQLKEFARIK